MKTIYELRTRFIIMNLKALMLASALAVVGFTTFAQQGKAVKVANDQQLIEAMNNPSVSTVVLEAGYYDYINYQASSGEMRRA